MLSDLGNCALRAYYAGFILATILPESVKISASSHPSKDQHVIQIKANNNAHKQEWFVYDPFTNPEVIFPHNLYVRDVLSKFPNTGIPREKIAVTITKKSAETFLGSAPSHIEKIKSIFLKSMNAKSALRQDLIVALSLAFKNISLNDEESDKVTLILKQIAKPLST